MVTIEGKKYLSVAEIATRLRLSRERVRVFISTKRLAGAVQPYPLAMWFVPLDEVSRFAKVLRKVGRPFQHV